MVSLSALITLSSTYVALFKINVFPLFSSNPPGGSDGKESASNAGDQGSIPGSGRSVEEGNGYPLQYSCLENSKKEEPGRLPSTGSQGTGHEDLDMTE